MIEQIVKQINSKTKKIKVGIHIYGEIKRELGSFSNKIHGVDYELDESLEKNSFVLE